MQKKIATYYILVICQIIFVHFRNTFFDLSDYFTSKHQNIWYHCNKIAVIKGSTLKQSCRKSGRANAWRCRLPW